MALEHEIIDITPENVTDYDMLCMKSKKSSQGYQAKLGWFADRYAEGLRMKLLRVNERGRMTSRGVVEYAPGKHTWRAVYAEGYSVIHCLWVVGKWSRKGLGRALLDLCVNESISADMSGVVALTNEGTWLAGKGLFIKSGFGKIDGAPGGFELMVRKHKEAPDPYFPRNWAERALRYGSGMTVTYSDQCPYQPAAVKSLREFADAKGLDFKAIKYTTAKEARERSPSPYGVFSIVFNGRLISYTYQKPDKLAKMIAGL